MNRTDYLEAHHTTGLHTIGCLLQIHANPILSVIFTYYLELKKYLNKDRRICKGTERRNGRIKCPSLVQMCRSRRGEGGPEITDEEDIFNEGNVVPF